MIRNYNLMRSILAEPWYMHPQEAEKLEYLLTGIFSPALSIEPITREEMASIAYTQEVPGAEPQQAQSVGVIHIRGAMTKYDTLCAYGTQSYARMIRDMDANDQVSAIVLSFDSPGGMVAGTEELGEAISSAGKPVVAFVSDMACSAAYWAASCCREIIANNTTAQIGSIGVMTSIMDLTAFYERQGVKIHDIFPTLSKDKHEEFSHIKQGNYTLTQQRLGVLAEKFHSVVRAHRPGVTDDQLTGKVYYAQDVIGSLVDRIGTFDEALGRAAELATHSLKKHTTMQNTNLPARAAAAGVPAFESDDGSITLTAEVATAVDTALAAKNSDAEALTKAQGELAAAQQRITALETDVKAKEGRIAELEKEPATDGAIVAPATDGDQAGASPFDNLADALAAAAALFHKIEGE